MTGDSGEFRIRTSISLYDMTVRYTDVYCLSSAHTAERVFAVHMTVALILGPPTGFHRL